MLHLLLFGGATGLLLVHKRNQMQMLTRGMLRVEVKGHSYYVHRGPTAHDAATKLLQVEKSVDIILSAVQNDNTHASTELREDAQTLLNRLRGKRIEFMELVPVKGAPVAVNYGKGQAIKLCLYDPDSKQPAETGTLLAVVMHELAHIMEPALSKMVNGHSIHSNRFKRNEQYLMRKAITLGIVPEDGAIGMPYCGITIPDPDEAT